MGHMTGLDGQKISFPTGHNSGPFSPQSVGSDPEVSRELRFPDYMTTVRDGGKVVSLTHRPPLPPGNAPGTHFC